MTPDQIDPAGGIPFAIIATIAWITIEVWCARADR